MPGQGQVRLGPSTRCVTRHKVAANGSEAEQLGLSAPNQGGRGHKLVCGQLGLAQGGKWKTGTGQGQGQGQTRARRARARPRARARVRASPAAGGQGPRGLKGPFQGASKAGPNNLRGQLGV